ncbi:(2Fe-2S) ferredoxin domain-containing protein [Priestia endophytica]|uniref:Ferredoxin n=1 Tax=Priestia endophytica TaxID=135735 RepID=A0AAX1Q7I7_9BACI|nr:(2Fe-2S) ferredoxin domain-containing protein [Priestia endophytica]RAS75471.1 ferredoxin [Priestia endophytica]
MATWNLDNTKHHILICNGSSCNQNGAEELTQSIRKEICERDLDDVIHTTRTRCNGRCLDKCVAIHYPKGTWYKDLKPEDTVTFIKSVLEGNDYKEKVSHTFTDEGFVRNSNVPKGVSKDKEKVKKVSKIL